MLVIDIPEKRFIINNTNEIITIKPCKLQLEHSLISLRKWEQKIHKPFLGEDEKTRDEIIEYIRCMTINNVDENVYLYIKNDPRIITEIISYIKDPMTATWFNDNSFIGAQQNHTETITCEIIYYWMISYNIPVEFEKWHLNTLLTLIKVISLKNQGPKKMTPQEASAQRRMLNAQRRAKMKSKG